MNTLESLYSRPRFDDATCLTSSFFPTFSTIMDGGLTPAGPGTQTVAVESITGALLIALLVFVLGRRTTR